MSRMPEHLVKALDPKTNPHITQRICTQVVDGVVVPQIRAPLWEALRNCARWNANEAKKHSAAPKGTYGHRTLIRLTMQAQKLNEQADEAYMDYLNDI